VKPHTPPHSISWPCRVPIEQPETPRGGVKPTCRLISWPHPFRAPVEQSRNRTRRCETHTPPRSTLFFCHIPSACPSKPNEAA